ncbi:MAG: adenylate/guanylate cyclase domain-containing protein [Roseobacter sp.]
MNDLRSWLASIEMDKYFDVLATNEVDMDIIAHLTEQDLGELGVPLGDRKRLMNASKRLETKPEAVTPPGFQDAAAEFSPLTERKHKPIGELRQMTLMFVDLVNSTGLVQTLGVEKYRDALRAFQKCNVDAIRENFGYFAQFIGDGVVAYFGFPIANEDDAERAVLTGLQIIRSVAGISVDHEHRLSVRVGIATGDVLVDDLMDDAQKADNFALGNIPNLAARLQSLASPGQIAVSGRTRRLLGRNFDCKPIGQHQLKGFEAPMNVWLVHSAQSAELRFDKRRQGTLAPLIGREDELGLLKGRWSAASRGEGQAVFLCGEAGLGKSRLAEEVHEQIVQPKGHRISFQCSPYHQNSAFYPIKSHFNHVIGFEENDTTAQRTDKLRTFLEDRGGVSDEFFGIYANFLSVGSADQTVLPPPEQTNTQTIKVLLHYIETSVQHAPSLILFEDLHWIDPSSEELLGHLMNQMDDLSVLILGTYRPEYQPRWSGTSKVTTLSLPGLGPRQTEQLVESLNHNNDVLNGLVQAIVRRAEGVPLFVEEMVSMLARSPGSGWSDHHAERELLFPSNLKDLLRARLDHLTVTPDTVSICATLGRSFTPALVAAVAERDVSAVRAELAHLVQAQILVPHPQGVEDRFSFRHAMIRDVAYEAILPRRAKQLHHRIAETMVQAFPNLCAQNPEILALHYQNAHHYAEARDKWQTAAEGALRNYASQEAIAHLTAALKAHDCLPHDDTSDVIEIRLRQKLGVALEIRMWGSPDIDANLERLTVLNDNIGDREVAFSILDQLFGTHLLAGRPDVAYGYCERIAALLVDDPNPVMHTLCEHSSGMALLLMGEFDRAIAHFDRALSYRAKSDLTEINRYYPADPETIDTVMRCWARTLQNPDCDGLPAELDHAIKVSCAQKSEFTRCFALSIIATIYCTLEQPEKTRTYAKRAHAISTKIEFKYWEAWSSVILGWAEARCGQTDSGINTLQAGLARYVDTGSGQIIAFAKTLLADAMLFKNDVDGAREQISQARDILDTSTIRFHNAITDSVARKVFDRAKTAKNSALSS